MFSRCRVLNFWQLNFLRAQEHLTFSDVINLVAPVERTQLVLVLLQLTFKRVSLALLPNDSFFQKGLFHVY